MIYFYYLFIYHLKYTDIRIDWQVFEEENLPEKLIDFVTCYGRPFPERDSQGNEIISTKKKGTLMYLDQVLDLEFLLRDTKGL